VDDAPQFQQFCGDGKAKKRRAQVSKIEIRVYPALTKNAPERNLQTSFPLNAHNSNGTSVEDADISVDDAICAASSCFSTQTIRLFNACAWTTGLGKRHPARGFPLY
jgi:hypothetical protein